MEKHFKILKDLPTDDLHKAHDITASPLIQQLCAQPSEFRIPQQRQNKMKTTQNPDSI